MAHGASKLFTFLGAGYTGALLCNNAELVSDFGGKVARAVLHSVSKADLAKAYPALGSSADESLRRLSAEVAALAAVVAARGSGSSLTVVHGGSGSNNGLLVGASVAVVGGAAFLRLRGLDNVLYVTRASFRNGVSTLGAGLQSISIALARVRSALSERIDVLSSRLSDVASDVEQTRAGVESLGEQLSTVEGKLDAVSSKQDFCCRGVCLLCNAVSQALRKDGSTGMSDASKKLQHHAEDKTLLELLAAPSSGGHYHECVPLTGTLQEQLTAISTLASANFNMTGVA